jgi:hypothetical protein
MNFAPTIGDSGEPAAPHYRSFSQPEEYIEKYIGLSYFFNFYINTITFHLCRAKTKGRQSGARQRE